jgi:hypothetical protein
MKTTSLLLLLLAVVAVSSLVVCASAGEPSFAAKDAIRPRIIENRNLHYGEANINGAVNIAVTDRNITQGAFQRGAATSVSNLQPSAVGRSGPPVKEVNVAVAVKSPLVLWYDPRKPAPVWVGTVSTNSIVPDPRGTNIFGLGSAILPRHQAAAVSVYSVVDAPGLQIRPAPAVSFGSQSVLQGQTQKP